MLSQPGILPPKKVLLPEADAYIFDIDGTLLVTRDLVHWNALHQAMFEAYGADTTIEGIQYHGKTDLSILRAALAREGIDASAFESRLPQALSVVCREVETNSRQIGAEICPGITQLLTSIRESGRLIGVASGNLEVVGWHKVEAAGRRAFFRFGCFSDRCESRPGIRKKVARTPSNQASRSQIRTGYTRNPRPGRMPMNCTRDSNTIPCRNTIPGSPA